MTLAWPQTAAIESDFAVSPSGEVQPGLWAEVMNPFGRALVAGIDLNAQMDESPERGSVTLADLTNQTEADLAAKIGAGATGIVYRLVGACPEHCTPMQFGGLYLEGERAILSDVTVPTLVYIEGADVYFEFVSDLPATYMGWDVTQNALSLDEARTYRQGAFALAIDGAELRIVGEAA